MGFLEDTLPQILTAVPILLLGLAAVFTVGYALLTPDDNHEELLQRVDLVICGSQHLVNEERCAPDKYRRNLFVMNGRDDTDVIVFFEKKDQTYSFSGVTRKRFIPLPWQDAWGAQLVTFSNVDACEGPCVCRTSRSELMTEFGKRECEELPTIAREYEIVSHNKTSVVFVGGPNKEIARIAPDEVPSPYGPDDPSPDTLGYTEPVFVLSSPKLESREDGGRRQLVMYMEFTPPNILFVAPLSEELRDSMKARAQALAGDN